MIKVLVILFIFNLFPQAGVSAAAVPAPPAGARLSDNGDSAVLTWHNPADPDFSATILFRSAIPIEKYFSYQAVERLCEKIYEGTGESFTDTGLAVNLPYYYVLFARDRKGSTSDAVVLEKLSKEKDDGARARNTTLSGVAAPVVNSVSLEEAGIILSYNGRPDPETDENARRLALFIIVKSPHDLSEQDKAAIAFFIREGTPTTILLGAGERAGVLNSYLSVFNKLPRRLLEWQDIIKIANGRWPDERNEESEKRAADVHFSAIYERPPDMADPRDNAAVTVIAYGLRPGNRNLESEKTAANIFKSIFGRNPAEATDWDMIRAIAYSGARR